MHKFIIFTDNFGINRIVQLNEINCISDYFLSLKDCKEFQLNENEFEKIKQQLIAANVLL